MVERLDIEYVGQYKSSARAKQVLRRGEAYVDSPMVDWSLYGEWSKFYHLDPEKDNKSVWDPRWLVRGLARFGSTVPISLASKFERQTTSTDEQHSGLSRPQGTKSKSARTQGHGLPAATTKGGAIGSQSRHGSNGSPVAWTFDRNGRMHLSIHGDLRNRGRRGPGFDAVVYEQAKNATFSAAGGGSRRYAPKDESEVVEYVLHMDKSAGAPFFRSVGDSVEQALEFARRVRCGIRAFDPYVAYRRVQHSDSGPKGRLVWGSPLATTILSSTFAKAAYEGAKQRQVFAYGYRKGEVGAILTEFSSRFKRVYCVDFSGFDSSIPASVLGDAFEVLKSYLHLTVEEKDLYYRLTNDFIHSRLILPDGSMYQKHRGIPSGSPFTSLIGSISNLIVLNYMWIKVTGVALTKDRVMVLGDDSVVGTNANPSLRELADAASDLGMQVDLEDSKIATGVERVIFLGHEWANGRPHRAVREVVIRAVFEEKHHEQDPLVTILRLYGYTSDCVEAYRLVMSLIWNKHVPLDACIVRLASEAKQSPTSLSRAGPGRLRYLASVEPELMLDVPFSNGKLAACGMFNG